VYIMHEPDNHNAVSFSTCTPLCAQLYNYHQWLLRLQRLVKQRCLSVTYAARQRAHAFLALHMHLTMCLFCRVGRWH
jgi:hypothetical protein